MFLDLFSRDSKKTVNLSSNGNNNTGPTSKYKEFEQNTFNDWDINSSSSINNTDLINYNYDDDDDNDDDYDLDGDLNEDDGDIYFNDKFFKISIEDSNEVAKRIIKDHSDKQKTNLFNKLYNKNTPQMPGKAFRQQQNESHNSNNNGKDSLSSNQKSSLSSANSNNNTMINTINSLSSNNVPKALVSTTITTVSPAIATSISSVASNSNNNNQLKNYSSKDNDIEIVKCEKFRNILATNPINLEELQKASWKGISKAYRPICWKLLSVCIFKIKTKPLQK